MNKKEIILVILVSVFVFLIVYSPHFGYHFPFHIDEWHSIAEAIKLGKGEYQFIGHVEKGVMKATMGYEIGFHAFLYVISLFINLVNLSIFSCFMGCCFRSSFIFRGLQENKKL
jgi:hypothetical protein